MEYKRQVVADLARRFSSASSVVLVEFCGISVDEINELRTRARAERVDYLVAKNNLIKRAIAGTPFECLQSDLSGPTALGIGYDDPLKLIKLLCDFSSKFEGFKIKSGYVDGSYAGPGEIVELSKLPGREVLTAKLLGALMGPVSRLVCTLNGPIVSFLNVLNAIGKRAKQQGPGEESVGEASRADAAGD